jgi:hypothetical protein
MYTPEALVVTERCAFVAVLVMATMAPATTPPEASVTVPVNSAVGI